MDQNISKSNLIDYVILALVFAVVIHIFIKTFNKPNNEDMYCNQNSQHKNLSYGRKKVDLFEEASHNTRSISESESVPVSVASEFESSPGNQLDYIQQFVANAGKVCEEQVPEKTIQETQNDFFKFNETINYSTREGISEVDRINQMMTSHNNELVNSTGKKISDVYDELVKNDCDKIKKCKFPKCVIPTSIDPVNKSTLYKKQFANGNAFIDYGVMFETDGVNNGGKFYDDVEASDSMSESNAIY